MANYSSTYLNSTVTGQPFDDPRGRWRVGGVINVPLKVTFQTNKTQASEIKSILPEKGIQTALKNDDKKDETVINKEEYVTR